MSKYSAAVAEQNFQAPGPDTCIYCCYSVTAHRWSCPYFHTTLRPMAPDEFPHGLRCMYCHEEIRGVYRTVLDSLTGDGTPIAGIACDMAVCGGGWLVDELERFRDDT